MKVSRITAQNGSSKIESPLLTTARVSTFDNKRLLTAATGFFLEREGRLFS